MMASIDEQDVARLSAFYARVAEGWSLDVVDETTIENVAAALLIARSTTARAVASEDLPHAKKTYLTALGAPIRGSFRARPRAVADPLRLFGDSLPITRASSTSM